MMTLYTLIVVLLLFGATIFIHELGHFLVARRLGLVVDVFAIGFGPAIWKRTINGVTYKICWLPFGGYVALPQMDPSGGNPNDEASKDGRALPGVTPWKKILVSVAGPIGNIIMAYLLAVVVYLYGKPSSPHEVNTIIGSVETSSVSYAQGLRIGDEILSMNGRSVRNWDDIVFTAALSSQVVVEVKSADAVRTVTLDTKKSDFGIHMIPGVGWMNYSAVAAVIPGSSAQKAGIQRGDLIVEFNGEKLFSREHLIALVAQARDRDVPAAVQRGTELVHVTVRPAYDEKVQRALIGIQFNTLYVDNHAVVHPSPAKQVREYTLPIFRFLRALVTPNKAKRASEAVGGPLMILYMFWLTVQNSLILAISFTIFVNVNLAVFNLLPLPVLDGGHITFALWEALTKRPVGPKVVNLLWNAFAILLIGLVLTLTYRDFTRLILGPMTSRPAPPSTNAAPAATNAPAPVP
ncbi:MAG: RIP metalloprotease RseP [bacterium]